MKKWKDCFKVTVLFVAALLLMILFPHTAYADEGKYTYSTYQDGITITSYEGEESDLVIPNQIDGESVLGIDENAFGGLTTLKSVVIPETVISIGENAFSDCTYLTEVKFLGNAPVISEQNFQNCAADLKFYYYSDKTGFGDTLNGYPTVSIVAVKGIEINKTTAELPVGGTLTLIASLKPADVTNPKVIWTSSNPKVATVDEAGKVVTIGAGNVIITATSEDGGFSATCNINVAGLPQVPTGEYANALNTNSVKVFWSNASSAIGYEVYRSNTVNGKYSKISTVQKTEFTDQKLKLGTVYYYKIRSYRIISDKKVYSEYTPVISIKTLDNSIGSKLFLYMSVLNNRNSVFDKAVKLHHGDPNNTCAITVSEAFRRIGMDIPTQTARTEQVERNLKARGWKREMNLKLLQPGDICFTTDAKGNLTGGHSTHTFIFMSWANKEKTLMNICDNQANRYGGYVYHTRTIFKSKLTDATAFFYHTDQTNLSIILKLSNTLKVKALDYNKIQISWGSAVNAYGYKVYRATSKYGTYKEIASTRSNTYTDKAADTGKTYYYKVRAYSTADILTVYGNYTSIYSAKTKLEAPVVKSSSTVKKKITLSWAKVSGASGYEVYRATSKNGKYSKRLTSTNTTYSNTGLVSNKIYYYKVRAYRTIGKTKVYSSYYNVTIKSK